MSSLFDMGQLNDMLGATLVQLHSRQMPNLGHEERQNQAVVGDGAIVIWGRR